MELTGKRVAVLAEAPFEDLELWYPLLRLREAGDDGGRGHWRRPPATRGSTACR